jgi:hypothetical protein
MAETAAPHPKWTKFASRDARSSETVLTYAKSASARKSNVAFTRLLTSSE